MPALGATLYPGTPNAGVFSNTISDSSPLSIDTTTGNMYYYKSGTGVVQVIGIPLAGPVTIPGPVTVNGNLTVTGSGSFGIAGVTSTGNVTTAGQLVSTIATGTPPLAVNSTTAVANLNASFLQNSTWATPLSIGSTTPNSGFFSTLRANGQFTSAVLGVPPFVVSSNLLVTNLNANFLQSATWDSPAPIGSTAKNSATFTTCTVDTLSLTGVSFAGAATAGLGFLSTKPGASTNGQWIPAINAGVAGRIPFWPD